MHAQNLLARIRRTVPLYTPKKSLQRATPQFLQKH